MYHWFWGMGVIACRLYMYKMRMGKTVVGLEKLRLPS